MDAIEKDESNLLVKAERSTIACNNQIRQLQIQLASYSFKNIPEQISFYKEIRPKFLALYFYYNKVFKIELNKPIGTTEQQETYLETHLKNLKEFFDYNRFFYQYYRSGSTHLDEKLFIRDNSHRNLNIHIYECNEEPSFDANYDYIYSRIIANDRILIYINSQLQKLQTTQILQATTPVPSNKLIWTASNTDLIELLYAFQSAGVFNNGKATLKQIVDFFQAAFDIDLKNYSRTFQEALYRKSGLTTFLNFLIQSLNKRRDDIEDKY